jgi:glycosyltransferase involved in cell wall biosynthesis
LFVGRLDGEGSPNVDSLDWFVRNALPLIARQEPDIRLEVIGKNDAPTVRALAGEHVHLSGPVDDLSSIYDSARVFVAPTRFAAGIPHKVHEAAAHGVPAVVSPLLAAQLGWSDGEAVRLGSDASSFAAAVLDLYRDETLWTRIRESALRRIAEDCSLDRFRRALLTALGGRPSSP